LSRSTLADFVGSELVELEELEELVELEAWPSQFGFGVESG